MKKILLLVLSLSTVANMAYLPALAQTVKTAQSTIFKPITRSATEFEQIINLLKSLSTKIDNLEKIIYKTTGPVGPICPSVMPPKCGDNEELQNSNSSYPCPSYQCVPKKTVGPEPFPACVTGFAHKGTLCSNDLASLVYKLGEDSTKAIALSTYAKNNFGVSLTCDSYSKLTLNEDGKSVYCDKSGYTGVVTPKTQWTKVTWQVALGNRVEIFSYVDPNVSPADITKAKEIIAGCSETTIFNDIAWDYRGVPVACKRSTEILINTPPTTPNTGPTRVPETFKTCLYDKGVAAGSTRINVDSAIALMDSAFASRVGVSYGPMDNKLYPTIAECERQTSFYLISSNTGSGPYTGGYPVGYTGCGQYDSNETQCKATTGCEWKIPGGLADNKYYCMNSNTTGTSGTGSSATACAQAGGTWNSTSFYCNYPGSTYTGTGTSGSYSSSCSSDIASLLGSGCHLMYTSSNGTNRYCNGEMNKHIDGPSPTVVVDGCASFTTSSLFRNSLLGQVIQLFSR